MSGRHATRGRRDGSFDAFDVASRRASFAGRVEATSLPRIAGLLAPDGGDSAVTWRIAGSVDAVGRPALEIQLEGAVPLLCQRCLKPFSWPVEQRTLLLLARDERELARLDAEDEHEVLLAASAIEIASLVEDELLLTLPFVPRCERVDCVGSAIAAGVALEAPAPAGAFATLASLKSGTGKKDKT